MLLMLEQELIENKYFNTLTNGKLLVAISMLVGFCVTEQLVSWLGMVMYI